MPLASVRLSTPDRMTSEPLPVLTAAPLSVKSPMKAFSGTAPLPMNWALVTLDPFISHMMS